VLVHERTAILCVAAKAKLIQIGGLQILARGSSVRVMAIDAGHLPFANRVMVGQAGFRSLRLVALQAGFVCLSARPERYAAFGSQGLHHRGTPTSRCVEGVVSFGFRLEILAVNLVAISAADAVHRVRAARPVPHLVILSMAPEAHAIRIPRRSLVEADDFTLVASAFNVKTAVAVAVLAFNTLLGVKGVTVSHGVLSVTGGAHIGPHAGRTCDFDILSVGFEPVGCVLGGRRLSASASGQHQQKGQAEAGIPHKGPPVASWQQSSSPSPEGA
jgi:hypothetical protein